ncbi:hypothetical protein [Xanthomonas campestris]|uniref:hypothetical protein n=1 Tax=Xanthomonas campestris TaxID=339 RepID=UPI0023689BD6|nr:hypothetical protein [Xanthomonas campestris]WDJ87441.1 hypothetical protein JH279_22090 [Xanthomonas campestris pv. incanae]WDJ96209.1 hypothetical protein JH260_21655 [Xanthomonas campestris pv. incanae]
MFSRLPNPASLSPEERAQYRSSMVGGRYSEATEVLADGSAIYMTDEEGRYYLTVFAGKALRPCATWYYRKAESRAAYVEEFKTKRAMHHATQLLRRAAAKKPHTLTVGAILFTSWGYEQTNTEFYQVVSVAGSMVTLRQIESEIEPCGHMSGNATPVPDHFIGEPLRRRARADSLKIDACSTACVWDGRPKHVSWYA